MCKPWKTVPVSGSRSPQSNHQGELKPDSLEEYATLWDDLPKGWRARKGRVVTRAEGPRDAWTLTRGSFSIGAVAHETGIEALIPNERVSKAKVRLIDELLDWLWDRWQQLGDRGAPGGRSRRRSWSNATFPCDGLATADARTCG